MQKDFNTNREHHYRAQLIALQHDMNLVTQADPYGPEPLEDSPDEIDRMVQLNASGTPFQSEMSSLAGKWYTEFVSEVNEAKENKEIELIQLAVSAISCTREMTELTCPNRKITRCASSDSNTNATIDCTLRPKNVNT